MQKMCVTGGRNSEAVHQPQGKAFAKYYAQIDALFADRQRL